MECVGMCECGWTPDSPASSVMATKTLPFEQTECLPIS